MFTIFHLVLKAELVYINYICVIKTEHEKFPDRFFVTFCNFNQSDSVHNLNIQLTHISLASFLWDIYKDQTPQNTASDQGLHCLLTLCSITICIKMKNTTQQPQNWK